MGCPYHQTILSRIVTALRRRTIIAQPKFVIINEPFSLKCNIPAIPPHTKGRAFFLLYSGSKATHFTGRLWSYTSTRYTSMESFGAELSGYKPYIATFPIRMIQLFYSLYRIWNDT